MKAKFDRGQRRPVAQGWRAAIGAAGQWKTDDQSAAAGGAPLSFDRGHNECDAQQHVAAIGAAGQKRTSVV